MTRRIFWQVWVSVMLIMAPVALRTGQNVHTLIFKTPCHGCIEQTVTR